MRTSFGTKGFDALERQMAALGRGIPDDRKRAALHEGAELIAQEAQRLAPYLTGALRDSILVSDDAGGQLYAKVSGAGLSVYVGPVGSTEDGDVYYAKFQEFGTVHMVASPFMRPAVAAKGEAANRLVMTRLATIVLETAR